MPTLFMAAEEMSIRILSGGGMLLPPRHRRHPLIGPWAPPRDCHVEPERGLGPYGQPGSLKLERTGAHADLLRMKKVLNVRPSFPVFPWPPEKPNERLWHWKNEGYQSHYILASKRFH
jgi:mRNA-degrading endonuclease YafQ of YafQ-DinJ toxin-antitoxin module